MSMLPMRIVLLVLALPILVVNNLDDIAYLQSDSVATLCLRLWDPDVLILEGAAKGAQA
jgi:hypothetical protein